MHILDKVVLHFAWLWRKSVFQEVSGRSLNRESDSSEDEFEANKRVIKKVT